MRKYIGTYAAVLGSVDGLVFTAGIGERSPPIRELCCQGLSGLGIVLDPAKNRTDTPPPFEIHAAGSRTSILVIPTDEELEIAEQALRSGKETGRPAAVTALRLSAGLLRKAVQQDPDAGCEQIVDTTVLVRIDCPRAFGGKISC